MNYRRLIGPTIICLVASGLWLDYVFFSHLAWSPVNLLSKILVILIRIFRPLLDPALYFWVGEVFIPVTGIILGIVLLYVSVVKAKLAMKKVTPNVDEAVLLTMSELPPMREPSTEPASEPAGKAHPITVPSKSWKNGLVKKLAASYGTVGLLFAVAVCIIVYGFLCRAFEKEIKRRANAMATSINEIAAHQFGSKNVQALRNKVNKYAAAADDAVAYVYIEDGEGQIIAHTPEDLPRHLKRDFPRTAERALKGADVQYRDSDVYEISQRIADGGAGFVHVGLWRIWIEQEARRILTPIAVSIFVVLLGLVGIFAYIARGVNRPLLELVEHAERISKDDFTVELGLKRSDEIGDIARSLERMRSSLRAVAARLEQRQLTNRSGQVNPP